MNERRHRTAMDGTTRSAATQRGMSSGGQYARGADGRLHYDAPADSATSSRPEATDLFARSRWFPGLDGWARGLVMTLAFLIDTALHAGVAIGVGFAIAEHSTQPQPAIVGAALTWVVVSFAHRTFFQRLTYTTIGKAVFGLRLHNPGDYPITLWQLIKLWCFAVFVCLANVADAFP